MCVTFSIGPFERSLPKERGDQNLSTMKCTWWNFRVLQEDLASAPGKEVLDLVSWRRALSVWRSRCKRSPGALGMNAVVGFFSVPFLASVSLPGSLLPLPTCGGGKWGPTHSCFILNKPPKSFGVLFSVEEFFRLMISLASSASQSPGR